MSKGNIVRYLTNSEDFIENRKAARLDIAVKVAYRVIGQEDHSKAAVSKDISPGGCLLLAAEEITSGAEVELQIFLNEEGSEALNLKGKIVRLNRKEGNLFEYGITFEAISQEARRLLADYFFARMYEMIGLPQWPTNKRIKGERSKSLATYE